MDVSYCNSLVCGRLRSIHWIFRFICLPEIPHLKKCTTLIKLRNKILCLYIAKFAPHPCASVRNISCKLAAQLHQLTITKQASQLYLRCFIYHFKNRKMISILCDSKEFFCSILKGCFYQLALRHQHSCIYIYLPPHTVYSYYHCCHHIFTAIKHLYVQKSHVRALYSKTEYIFSHSKNYRKMYSVLYFPYVECYSKTEYIFTEFEVNSTVNFIFYENVLRFGVHYLSGSCMLVWLYGKHSSKVIGKSLDYIKIYEEFYSIIAMRCKI